MGNRIFFFWLDWTGSSPLLTSLGLPRFLFFLSLQPNVDSIFLSGFLLQVILVGTAAVHQHTQATKNQPAISSKASQPAPSKVTTCPTTTGPRTSRKGEALRQLQQTDRQHTEVHDCRGNDYNGNTGPNAGRPLNRALTPGGHPLDQSQPAFPVYHSECLFLFTMGSWVSLCVLREGVLCHSEGTTSDGFMNSLTRRS